MKWFKALAPDDEIMAPITDEFGLEGYGKFMAVWSYCYFSNCTKISITILKKIASCNERGAQKILPLFQKTLTKVWESLGNVSETLTNVSESLTKVEGQNPRGSIKEEKSREEENREYKKTSRFSERDFQTADFIFSLIRQVAPGAKKPNLESWANDVRLMVEQDKHTHSQIEVLFKWANQDKFWKSNILSPAKLRQQWTSLEMKMAGQQPKRANGLTLGRSDILPAEQRTGGVLKL